MPVIKLKSENDALKILNTELKAKIASLEMQISCFRDLNSDPEPQQILMKNLREKVSDLEEQLTILQTNSVKLIDALQKSQRDNYKMQEKIVRMVKNFSKLDFMEKNGKNGGKDTDTH